MLNDLHEFDVNALIGGCVPVLHLVNFLPYNKRLICGQLDAVVMNSNKESALQFGSSPLFNHTLLEQRQAASVNGVRQAG